MNKYLVIFEDGERRTCTVSNLKELHEFYYEDFKEEREIISVCLMCPFEKLEETSP